MNAGKILRVEYLTRGVLMKRFMLFAVLLMAVSTGSYAENLKFRDVQGKWSLMFRGNYGYEFRFSKSYRAICILYLLSSSLIFKGVYTIEEGNKLRINISEMKNEESVNGLNLSKKFVKTTSSYFVFQAEVRKEKKGKMLVLRPQKIFIDGNNSEGYFEPEIKLESR